MRRTWAGLGAPDLPAAPFWRLGEDGRVYLNTEHLAAAARALYGAAWLGPMKGEEPGGLAARLRAGSVLRRAETEILSAASGVTAMQSRLLAWLSRVRGLRWTQADLLQVMEELEPQAQSALQSYFTVRAGLEAAGARLADLLAQAWPARPAGSFSSLLAGLPGLPSVEAVYALAEIGAAAPDAFLARYGHRGAGDVRPDARRWRDAPAALDFAATHAGLRRRDEAETLRRAAERELVGALDSGRRRQVEPALQRTRELCRAADVAWESVILVMAAAQAWLAAVAREAAGFGLIADASEARFLELEELKQVATGEWHGGRRETVRAEIERRRKRGASVTPPPLPDRLLPASAGLARGPALLLTDVAPSPPQPGAILVTRRADAGWTDHWLYAAGLAVAAPEPWSPGVLVARVLGLPAVTGAGALIAGAQAEAQIVVDGETGRAGRA